MYLSKLTLNPQPQARLVQRDLSSPYEMHRTILRAFPDRQDGGPGRVLFRVEPIADGQPPVVLVQSDKQPDWSPLVSLPMYLAVPARVKEAQPRLRQSQRLRFRLRANPTVKKKAEGKENGVRHGIAVEADQLAWLQRKGQAGGFAILDVAIQRAAKVVSHAAKGSQTHLAVDFEGVLEVVDPLLLQQTLASGIGPAKGFGFGLLSVAPI